MNLSFNKKSLIVSKNKASANWEKHNFIFSRFSNILIEKVNEINSQFKNILLITSDAFECYNQLSKLNFENFIIISQYKKLLNKISPKKNFMIKKNFLTKKIFNRCIRETRNKNFIYSPAENEG